MPNFDFDNDILPNIIFNDTQFPNMPLDQKSLIDGW